MTKVQSPAQIRALRTGRLRELDLKSFVFLIHSGKGGRIQQAEEATLVLLLSVCHYSDLYLFYRPWMLDETRFMESKQHLQFIFTILENMQLGGKKKVLFCSFLIKWFNLWPARQY